MSFISIVFFICLFFAATIFYFVPARWRTLYMLALSYAFYATWSIPYLVLLLLATSVGYAGGFVIVWLEDEDRKLKVLYVSLGLIIALIVGFKLAGQISGVLFPLGLSYYSFKLMAYLIEVYWDDSVIERDAATFYLFPAFFPQIVSGPIQRPLDFFQQWRTRGLAAADYDRIDSGFRYILGGLMLKLLIGDRLGSFIHIIEPNPGEFNYAIVLTTVACFTLQLYADFAGYTNIALGIGKIFNIEGPPNFNAPFAASTIQEMWRRWHMSLTSWVTDYLFTPLQMSLRGWGQLGLYGAIIINMVVIGLWHGISVNFLIFGLLHAAFVCATLATAKWRARVFGTAAWRRGIGYGLGVILTFVLMTFSQIFWREHTFADSYRLINLVLGFQSSGNYTWSDVRTDVLDPLAVCMIIAFYIGFGAPGFRYIGRPAFRYMPNFVLYGLALLVISALTIDAGTKFIYGQF